MLEDEDFYDILFGDHPNYKIVEEESVVDTGRWHNAMEMVIQDVGTGNYYRLNWLSPATEYQECKPDPTLTRVYPKQVTKTIYTTKKED